MYIPKEALGLRITNFAFYLVMVISMYAFDRISLNGVTLFDALLSLDTPLTPDRFAFSVLQVIFVLLFCLNLYSFGAFHGNSRGDNPDLIHVMGPFFFFAMGAAGAYSFSLHFKNLLVCMILAFFLWFCLQRALAGIREEAKRTREKIFFRAPLSAAYAVSTSVFFLTAAMLFRDMRHNITDFGYSMWMYGSLIFMIIIGVYYTTRYGDYVFNMGMTWMLIGVFYKNIQIVGEETSFTVALLASVGIGVLLIVAGVTYLAGRNKPKLPEGPGHWILYD